MLSEVGQASSPDIYDDKRGRLSYLRSLFKNNLNILMV